MDIRSFLKEQTLLFDGAMGTWYAAQPGRAEARCELANLHFPQEITAIHRAYLDSGCKAIKTNTFSAGSDLAAGDSALARRIIESGARLAIEAAEP